MDNLAQQNRDCFICNKCILPSLHSVKVQTQRFSICKRFLKLASRYLNIPVSTYFAIEPEKTLDKNIDFKNLIVDAFAVEDLNLDCCEDCFLKVRHFCRFYDQWILIQIGLDHSSKEIAATMKKVKAKGCHNLKIEKIKNDRKHTKHEEINNFKRRFVDRVKTRNGLIYPKIELEKFSIPAKSLQQGSILKGNYDYHDDAINVGLKANTIETVSEDDASISNIGVSNEDLTVADPLKDDQATPCHSCRLCGKVFSYLSSLRRHEKVHLPIKPFKCTYCDSRFTVNQIRLEHQRVHTGEAPFSCKICGQTFKQKSACRAHEKYVHNPKKVAPSEEKLFTCYICGKGFVTKSSQRRHILCHTGEKKWACTFCGQRFAQNESRLDHEKNHTGELPLKCGFCEKLFSRRIYCRLHQRREHLELIKTDDAQTTDGKKEKNEASSEYKYDIRIKCSNCPEMFTKALDLRSHIKRHHNIIGVSVQQHNKKLDNKNHANNSLDSSSSTPQIAYKLECKYEIGDENESDEEMEVDLAQLDVSDIVIKSENYGTHSFPND